MKNLNLRSGSLLVFLVYLSSCSYQEESLDLEGLKIASLRICHSTPKFVQDRRLANLISSQSGSTYSQGKVGEDIKSLYGSGLVNEVEFFATKNGDSVDLVASVSTRRGMGPVLFRGNTIFSSLMLWTQISKPLIDRISRAVTVRYDLVTDEPVDLDDERFVAEVLPAVKGQLEQFYRKKGYHHTRIRTESWKGGSATDDDFIFVIDERSLE